MGLSVREPLSAFAFRPECLQLAARPEATSVADPTKILNIASPAAHGE